MTISKAEAGREMDALVRELWGLVPADKVPIRTAMQELRQKIADALTEVQANRLPTGDWGWMPATPRGIQVGNIAAFEVVLEWIDAIAEGK